MHRHGYKGRKFGRERDQRRALMKGLADSLIIHETIETTLPKAKDLRSYVEKLITKAKVGDLHNRRIIISKLNTIEAAHKLVDEVAPKLTNRGSGYLRISKTTNRKGDNALLAKISFVDDLSKPTSDVKKAKPEAPKVTKTTKKEAKKPVQKKPATKDNK